MDQKRKEDNKIREEILTKALKVVAPGTELRLAIDHIIRARTGALIVVGDSREVLQLVRGGFNPDCEFSQSRVYELAKMDGAIILKSNLSRIIYANAHLMPDPSISSNETGTRHRTAEQVAKQTGALVISISQKRDIVTLYTGNIKFALDDLRIVLAKASQAIQALERYKERLDQVTANLNALEFENLVTLADLFTVVQRTQAVLRISAEIRRYISELGVEGRLVKMQLDELITGVEIDYDHLIVDYAKRGSEEKLKRDLLEMEPEDLLDPARLAKLFGYPAKANFLDYSITPKGYRLLSKVPRIPELIVANIVKRLQTLPDVLQASIRELDEVEGVGEARAMAIHDGLKRLKDYNLMERYV